MKKKILSIALGLTIMAIGTTAYASDKTPVGSKLTANEKAMKNFTAQFAHSADAEIYTSNSGFVIQSQVDGHEVRAAYNKNGNWVYSIKLFSGDNVEKEIVDIIKNRYNSYVISTVEKVDQPGDKSIYVVHIQDKNTFKTIRVSNNEVELIEDFTKA